MMDVESICFESVPWMDPPLSPSKFDRKLFYAFWTSSNWMKYIRRRYFSDYANREYQRDGRLRSNCGQYMTKEVYVQEFLKNELRKCNDMAEYVYEWTNSPELAVMFLKFNKHGQIKTVLKRMSQMSDGEKHYYMRNLLNKGKEFIK